MGIRRKVKGIRTLERESDRRQRLMAALRGARSTTVQAETTGREDAPAIPPRGFRIGAPRTKPVR